MLDNNDDTKKIVTGLIIGSVVGATIMYAMHASRSKHPPVVQKIGKTLSEVGEMLEQCDFSGCSKFAHECEKNLPSERDVMDNILNWVETGMSLWKKFKKGY